MRAKIISVFLLLTTCNFCAANNDSNVMKIVPKAEQQYHQNDSNETQSDDSYIPYDLQIIVGALEKLNFSQCAQDAMTVLGAISRRDRWALKMFDASSKFPVGILHGAFYQFGNYDECLSLKQTGQDMTESPIQGQYCLADVEIFKKSGYGDGRIARSYDFVKKPRYAFNNTIYWGICTPSSCSVEEVRIVVKEIFTLATGRMGIDARLNGNKCQVYREEIPVTKLEVIYGSLVGTFLAFIIFATAFHYHGIQQKKKSMTYTTECSTKPSLLRETIYCFSILKNVKKFWHTKPSHLNLECICGIRLITMFFIITGHTMIFLAGGPVLNTDFFEQQTRNIENSIFTNSPLLVDTFLLISGFLMCYMMLIETQKRKRMVNPAIIYVARYIRLTPSYLVVIGLYMTIMYRMGDGPLWDTKIKLVQERCFQSWWTNLLYINNYVNTDAMCMFQSWYLAVDYHLFIIAPIIIYPLWKWHRIGKGVLGVSVIVSLIIPFWVTYANKLDPTLLNFAAEMYDLTENFYFKTAYIKTHMRASSYLVGLLFGYVVFKLQINGKKIPKYVLILGWSLATLCGLLSLCSVIIFYSPHHQEDALKSAIYATFHRVAWCASIGWVILVCITNNANIVNKILSWKGFIPLSRLTYCAYLTNGFVEIYSSATLRSGTFMSKFEMVQICFSHLVLTFAAAFVLCILFESPIHGLEKVLLKANNPRKEEQARTQQSSDENSVQS